MINFKDLQFMSIGSNCVYLACFDRKTRLKGPMDNAVIKSVNGLKLVINNELYDFVKNTASQRRHKNSNEFRPGDCEWETIYPNRTICFVHNIPEGDKFFAEFKIRCDRLAEFLTDVKENDNKWLIFTLNGNFVKYHTGELIENSLEEVFTYLSEIGLLSKTIIIGSRVLKSEYKVFDHHLNRESFNKLKEKFSQINYIELNDVNAWEPDNTIKQFNEKMPIFIEAILARKEQLCQN